MLHILTALLLVSLFGLFTGCGKPAAIAVQAQSTPSDPNEIKLDDNLAPRVKIGEVEWATVGASFSVAGRVEVDETRTTRVGSPVMGRITSLAAAEGQEVHSGQVLATILSTGLSQAQLDFLKAISQHQVAKRAVDRAQVLLKADVIGSAELQRREAELSEAGAALDAARDQLLQLGMPAEAIEELRKTRTMNSVSSIPANMDGTVLERKVTPGQMVQPADTIYEIADLSQVWLVADVPEANAGNLRVGQVVEAKIAALPGMTISGKLAFVSATVNPETRTVMVRMNVPNRDKKLKPAMLATMELKEHTERQQVVPMTAVVRDDNRECLFVQRAANMFTLREVKFGEEHSGKRVLLDGIRPGERIIVDGAFHLNNERRRRAVRGDEGS